MAKYRDDLFEPRNMLGMALAIAALTFLVFGIPWLAERFFGVVDFLSSLY